MPEDAVLAPMREEVAKAKEAFLAALQAEQWFCHCCGHAIAKPERPCLSDVWDQVGRTERFSGAIRAIAHCDLERDGRIALDSRFCVVPTVAHSSASEGGA